MPNLAQLLITKSSAEYLRVFELCREISDEVENIDGVYVVGGIVRDLVLDRNPGDIDISVVGDGSAFSNALAKKLGAGSPVESQFLTFKIDVTGVFDEVSSIDIVTARSETYSEPAALPEISISTIQDDLKRRDFTVNSMAISLSSADWGILVDPANGFGDIMRKRIKVHHDGSFIDDPTRIFRAVRYATRLGFTIENRTSALIDRSMDGVDRLSGTRVRNEFELLLAEPKLAEILRKSEEIGLIGAISPGLRISSRVLQVLDDQTESGSISTDIPKLLGLLSFGMNEEEASQVVDRLEGVSGWGDPIIGSAQLAKHVAVLDSADLLDSEIAELLRPIPLPSIRAYIVAGPPLPRRQRMIDYVEKIQFIKPEITGDDLLKLGIPQGPVIGQLIDVVRRAKLDGKVNTKQEEIELAQSRLPGFLTK
ncbi:CCA tRNA nucleotidyltransferase [Dehalococcoides mccartyi]|nr:CCA tRNA nucleotidyltransferase [Dehalococcoides mccartyi]